MPPANSAIWNRAEEIVHLLKEGWTLDRLAKHLRTIICAAASSPPTDAPRSIAEDRMTANCRG